MEPTRPALTPQAFTRQRQVLDAFDAALAWPEHEVERRLREASADDPALGQQLRTLLGAEAQARRALPTRPPEALDWGGFEAPARIGPYRLTSLLGEGGMGAVWRGERDDGLFEQVVAVKLIRAGRIRPSAAAQFDTERRVLARLRHPAIAALFDGGTDAEGRAWFAMELVSGEPLTDYVRQRGLGLREAVRLLLPVCAAVQHAHQALVVHADIKPGNILVDAGQGPKLLDFGIARNLLETEEDAPGGSGLTLAYASPERRRGERPRPADDVYALGCLLHEIVTGEPPPTAPPPPLPRSSAPAELAAVVAKAAAGEPEARYGGAEALAEDLQRWLDGRPVRALSPSRHRSVALFARRRPATVAASLAAALGLVGALATISVLYVQAQASRAAAEQRFADVRGLAHHLLFDLYDRLERTPRSLQVRRDLAVTGQRYLERLADGGARDDVRIEAAQGFVRLAEIQGGERKRNLGQVDEARASLDRAVGLAQRVGVGPLAGQAALVEAGARLQQSDLAINKDGDAPRAERLLAQSRRALARLPAREQAIERASLAVEQSLALSALRQWQGRYPESLAAAAAAMRLLEQAPGGLAGARRGRALQARALDAEAETRSYAGDEAGAEAPYRRQLLLLQQLRAEAPDDPLNNRALARSGWALGVTLVDLKKTREAVAVLGSALATARALVAFDPEDALAQRTLRIGELAYAQALAADGHPAQAIGLLSTQVAARRTRSASGRVEAVREDAISLGALAEAQAQAGRAAAACASYRGQETVFEGLRRRGRLTALDVSGPLAAARAGAALACR